MSSARWFLGVERVDIPQRLQSVCDLLWRLPKDEVPFAVVIVSYCMLQNLDVHSGSMARVSQRRLVG